MRKLLFMIFLTAFFQACSSNDSLQARDQKAIILCDDLKGCDHCVTIDKDRFQNAETANYEIKKVEIIQNCLNIEISASGCSGDTWTYRLIDKGAIAESYPVQRFLKLELVDNEACEAYITRNISFNIEPLQVEGRKAYLHLEKWDEGILYEY